MYENDPNVPTEELLKQIKDSCTQNTGSNIDNVALAMPTFSALLVKLSNATSEAADKNLKIQNKMIVLTSIILAISISQLSLAFLMFSSPAPQEINTVIPSAITSTQAIAPKDLEKPEEKTNKPINHNETPPK